MKYDVEGNHVELKGLHTENIIVRRKTFHISKGNSKMTKQDIK